MAIMSFGLPLLLAVIVMTIGWKLWEKPRHAKPPYWPPAAALGLGVMLAFVIQEGLPSIPVSQKWHSLLPALFAVTVIGATHRVFPRRRSLRFIPEMATAFIAAFALSITSRATVPAAAAVPVMVATTGSMTVSGSASRRATSERCRNRATRASAFVTASMVSRAAASAPLQRATCPWKEVSAQPSTTSMAVAATAHAAPMLGCPAGEIADCCGNCCPESWVGDGYCDNGAYTWNGIPIWLNCD